MGNDIFCKIVKGEIPSDKILEGDGWIAIMDVNPKAPKHALVIPRKHIESLPELNDEALAGALLIAARQVAEKLGIAKSGYRVMINNGKHGSQEIPHLHLHVFGGAQL